MRLPYPSSLFFPTAPCRTTLPLDTERFKLTHYPEWALARDGERGEDFLLVAAGEALAERARATDTAAAD